MSYQDKKQKTSANFSEIEMGKLPPQAIDLEEAILGAMLIDSECLKNSLPLIKERYFHKEINKLVFNAIYEIDKSGNPPDILMVVEYLRKINKLEEVGGVRYISMLTSKVSSSTNIEYHIAIVKEKYLKRSIIQLGASAIEMGYDSLKGPDEVINDIENEMSSISDSNIGIEYESNMTEDVVEVVKKNMTKRKDSVTGITTGNVRMDKITRGWQPADLIVLAARSSMGKTARAIEIALHAAERQEPVAVFSLEMSKPSLIERILLNLSEIDSDKVKEQTWDEADIKKYYESAAKLENMPIYINDKAGMTVNYIKSVARQRKRKHGLKLIVIDYLQYIETDNSKGNREQDIAAITRGLKKLAKELNVPVIALAQLSRAVEQRANKRPQLSDLRESGSIEMDADLVISLYRPSYYWAEKKDDPDYQNDKSLSDEEYKALTETIVLKHRNGPLARFKEYFVANKNKFYSDSPYKEEPLLF